MSMPLSIIGIRVDERDEVAPKVQEIITKHGREIIGRMGVPTPDKAKGLITVIYEGRLEQAAQFREELEAIPGVDVQIMNFL